MKLNKLFYSGHDEINYKKELINGIYLFIIAIVIIQWNADLLRTSFESNIFNAIIPVLLFMLCGFSGLFSVLQGILFKRPLLVLPNLMLTVLISVYGTYALGHSINHIMIAAFIAIMISSVLFFLLPEKIIQQLIPSALVHYFPVVLGILLIVFGSIKAGILIRFIEPTPSTLVSSSALTEWHFPFRLGYFIQPVPIMVFAGFVLYALTSKKNFFHSPFIIFLILTVIGFFIPMEWGRSQSKGFVSSFQAFSFITSNLKASNFAMFFSNWQASSIRGFYSILSTSPYLIKLVFLFLVTFIFSNLYNLQTLHQLWSSPNDSSDDHIQQKTFKNKPVSLVNHLFSLIGISTNVTFFMTSAESGVAIEESSQSGFSSVFSGLLLMATACLIPLGFLSTQAGFAFIILFLGFSMLNRGLQPILKQKSLTIIPVIVFILVTLLTFNPAEGLVMSILVNGIQRFMAPFLHQKGESWKEIGFLIAFILSLSYLVFYIMID